MNRRHLLALALAGTTLSLGLSACGDDATASSADADEGAVDKIVIGYQLIPNGDLVVKNQHLLEKAFGDDVTIEWKQFDSGGSVNEAILAGSIDIGLAGSSPVSRGLSTGVEYVVPWIHDVIGSAEALVAKPGVASIEDLKGKTVATPFASTSHYSLLAALDSAGIDAAEVKIIDSEPDAILAAWTAGHIDAAYVWNPVLAELVSDEGTVLTDSAELAAAGKTTYDLAVVTTEFADQHPDAVQTWLDAENTAVKALQSGDQAAIDSIAAELNISADEVSEQLEGLQFVDAAQQSSADYLAGVLPANLIATAKFNQTLGQIPSTADDQTYQDSVVTTFAEKAK